MHTITETDSGKYLLTHEPTAEARSRGAQPRRIGLYRTRAAAERARNEREPDAEHDVCPVAVSL